MEYWCFNEYLFYNFARLYYFKKEMSEIEMQKFIERNADYKCFKEFGDMKTYIENKADFYIDGLNGLIERYGDLKKKII